MIVNSNKFNEGIELQQMKKFLSVFLIGFVLSVCSGVIMRSMVESDLKQQQRDVAKLKEVQSCFDEYSRVPDATLNYYQLSLAKSGSSYAIVIAIEFGLALAYFGLVLLFVLKYKVLAR